MTPYRIHSRREIIALLRSIQDHNQLVSMNADGGEEAIVTSILDIDQEKNLLVVDRAATDLINQRIIASDNISFETRLDNIRIMFFASEIRECSYDNQLALCTPIPQSLIRLQRRDHYRVPTPVANPLRCTIRVEDETEENVITVIVPLQNISGGGIAVVDEKKLLDDTIGRVYKDCRIDLPGGPPITANLEVRNSRDLTLLNGKSTRRIGFMFVNLPNATMAAVQRYITKLERERNAKATGMG